MVWRIAVACVLTTLGLCAAAGQADTSAPPINDNYLRSLELNRAGTTLNHTDTLKDVRDTSLATTQTDLLDPPKSGGPAEPTSYANVRYGNTIWYDFYPDEDGTVRIRTAGFDNVICVYPFNRKTFLPMLTHRTCRHDPTGAPAEELLMAVKKGGTYTIQIGGVKDAGGPLEFLFDFVPVQRVRLSPAVTLKAKTTPTGIEVESLDITNVPTGAKVEVRCSRRCSSQAKTAKTVGFPKLHGTKLDAGQNLQIYVTASNAIGSLIEYRIVRGNFHKTTYCLEPGSRLPRHTCH